MPIEIIRSATMADALSAWERSRDLVKGPMLADVLAIDASVNEMPTALLHFKDYMILERELFVYPRNHVIWARTSRVDNPLAFMAPSGFNDETHVGIVRTMRAMADSGMPQDIWRMHLPLCAQTSWTARLSYRDAVRLNAYFYDVGDYIKLTNPKLATRLVMTATHMSVAFAVAFGMRIPEFARQVDRFKSIPLEAVEDGELVGLTRNKVGEFVSMRARMPIALRAQLVRHREIMFADDFLPFLKEPQAEQRAIGAMLNVQAVALASTWRAVMGKRTCWMAQADLWAPLANLWGSQTDGLPCADGHCPYAEDAKQRLAGNDPGAPCPRYSNLYSVPLADHQWEAAMREAVTKPNANMWRTELGVTP